MKAEYLGNKSILAAHKTAFLCSRQVSSRAVLRCYDWATGMRDRYIHPASSLQDILAQHHNKSTVLCPN